MKLGIIGLGKMGGNMSERLLKDKHEVVAFDLNLEAVNNVVTLGGISAESAEELVKKLESPRVIWMMVPAGAPVQNTIDKLVPVLNKGDIIIDGGNSNYRDSRLRAHYLKEKEIFYLDAGTSGGIWGLKEGYCIMVGGEENAFKYCEPIFKTLAPPNGYLYTGPSGSGHYVKMIHNGIEYGLMQAYAEGFEIMYNSDYDIKLGEVAKLWEHGSVVRSWLLELLADVLANNNKLEDIKAFVPDSGEGRWTVWEAIEKNVPAPIITNSLLVRLRSRQEEPFGAKILAALRNEFGGHAVKKKD
ncbi:MAG: decarboxylating 6-phosphogluconate dehydrogenase [Ignavibacteriae bacterium]|nr:MAG: decarboxylating 6-phosphogluconate dehydrogenase [Ignavibacteriota bacterium]